MDLSRYRNKLIGSEDERAVSPVIGVILMVAITVILAAVIAAFVMDLGDDMGGGGAPDAAVSSDVSNSDQEVQLSVTKTSDDVDKFVLRGDLNSSATSNDEYELDLQNTGDTETLTSGNTTSATPTEVLQESGTANIIAVSGDEETKAGSFEWDWE